MDHVNSNVEYWKKRWENGESEWHFPQVDAYLKKYYPLVTGKALPTQIPVPQDSVEFKENSAKAWFVPLCGKTLDIPFLLSLGYRVFGVEATRAAIEDLGEENGLGMKYDAKTSMFTGADGRLEIYNGDIFQCPFDKFAGSFDYVWDHGSLIALEYSSRKEYKGMLQRALGKSAYFRYLLEAVRYYKDCFGGPPRSLSDDDLEMLYGDWANVQFLESVVLPEDHIVSLKVPNGHVEETFYLITRK